MLQHQAKVTQGNLSSLHDQQRISGTQFDVINQDTVCTQSEQPAANHEHAGPADVALSISFVVMSMYACVCIADLTRDNGMCTYSCVHDVIAQSCFLQVNRHPEE